MRKICKQSFKKRIDKLKGRIKRAEKEEGESNKRFGYPEDYEKGSFCVKCRYDTLSQLIRMVEGQEKVIKNLKNVR